MTGFELGEGWRESELGSVVPEGKRTLWEYNENGVPLRSWVREEPVPPLPTCGWADCPGRNEPVIERAFGPVHSTCEAEMNADVEFGPGEGWKRSKGDLLDIRPGGPERRATWDGHRWRHWERIEPVPPLPTEPYTVIRVTWKSGAEVLLLEDGEWWAAGGRYPLSRNFAEYITGFEVLAEPRARQETELRIVREEARRETAKAVIQDLREMSMFTSRVHMSDEVVKTIEHKYGVES